MRCNSLLSGGGSIRTAVFVGNRWLCAMFLLSMLLIPCATSFASDNADAGRHNGSQSSDAGFGQAMENADVQKRILSMLLQSVDEEKLTSPEATCIRAVVEIARINGLPLAVLEEKIQEGCAKNINGLRICVALESVVDNLHFSKKQLKLYGQGVPDGRDIQITADVLLQGVAREQMTAFLSSYDGCAVATLAEALRLFALLKQSGVPVSDINKFITVVLGSKGEMARWKELPQLLSLAQKHGVSPRVVMQQALQAVKMHTPPHEFARKFSSTTRNIGFAE